MEYVKLNNGKKIIYKVKNATTLEFNLSSCVDISFKDNILKANEYYLEIGEKIPVVVSSREIDYQTYYVFSFLEKMNYLYNISEFEKNNSSLFITPLVLDKTKDKYLFNEYFINCYLDNNLDYCYLMYRYFPFKSFDFVNANIRASNSFADIEPFKDKRFAIFKMYCKPFKEDIQLFLGGAYSRLSEEAKDRIADFHKSSNNRRSIQDTEIVHVVERNPSLIETWKERLGLSRFPINGELRSKPCLEKEFFSNLNA